jgi:hypothetical protein
LLETLESLNTQTVAGNGKLSGLKNSGLGNQQGRPLSRKICGTLNDYMLGLLISGKI